jgi:hypothetical protein
MGSILTTSELEALAYDLGVEPDTSPVRYTSKRAPAISLNAVKAIIGEHGGETRAAPDASASVQELRRLAETGEVSVHELRHQLRAVGIDLGHEQEDAEDREHTARHEAGHAAAALALGWGVKWVDVGRGQTQVEQPTYASRDRGAITMDIERATIAAAGAAFTGVDSRRPELEGDRVMVRQHRTRWEDARAEAELMAADRKVRSLHRALTDALLASPNGRLEGGGSLRAVIEDWEK